jgi:hypothetical protein
MSFTTHESLSSTTYFFARKENDPKDKKYTKSNLPVKTCSVCGRPFEWRKKWAKVWDEVKYCSDRCRSMRNSRESDLLK